MQPPYESRNATIRNLFRGAALIILPTGAIFTTIGLVDFFGAFSGHGFPTKFWCVFIGLPMLAFGVFCFKVGFLRTITGYVAGEAAPVVKNTAEYVMDGLGPTKRKISEDTRSDSDNDLARRIRSLDALKEKGLVSESEYALKRQEILNEI